MRLLLLLASLWCLGCGTYVSVDADAHADESDSAVSSDAGQLSDAADIIDARDMSDASSLGDVADRDTETALPDRPSPVDARDGGIPCIGPEPRPPNVGRSCTARDGGIDPRLCDEVHYCGAQFVGGTPNAYVNAGSRQPGTPYRYESCDYYPAIVLSGYIDAYEVTVARFRTWVNAGMPTPPIGTQISEGTRWIQDLETSLRFSPIVQYNDGEMPGDPRPRMEACTWTPTEGANELRPMNCLHGPKMLAFCYWDGKQLVSDLAWEYLARNRATTEVPFGNSRNDPSICDIADVGGWVPVAGGTLCPSRPLPLSVFDRPLDVTSNPPGIYGLFGGVREFVYRTVYQSPGIELRGVSNMCMGQRRTQVLVEGQGTEENLFPTLELRPPSGANTARGASWYNGAEFEYNRFSATLVNVNDTAVGTGFRCGRRERPLM